MHKKLITIVTPTYNRISTLKNCYDSLLVQTSNNFIWMIIDDGSTDDTKIEVAEWIKEGFIQIQYKKKENGGKVSTLNYSLELCDTELWMCLDSDDILTKDAIEVIEKRYIPIKGDNKIAGLLSLRVNNSGNVIGGKRIPEGKKFTKILDLKYFDKINSENVLIFKTKIIKNYPYPIIQGENFFPLSYIFHQIDQDYILLVVQEAIMVGAYLGDGLSFTKENILKKNPKGYILAKKRNIEYAPNFYWKVREVITFIGANFLMKERRLSRIIIESPDHILSFLLLPVGYFYYLFRFKMNLYRKLVSKILIFKNSKT